MEPPDPPDPPEPVRVRRNLHDLAADGPELDAFRRGVAAMQARPEADPLGWRGQATIHEEDGRHNNYFFLSWHRMYLYWFERILRQASGDPNFALPYWDYTTPGQRVLPETFRNQDSPLYVDGRNPAFTNGDPPEEWMVRTTAALAETQFWHDGPGLSFGGAPEDGRGALENIPHDPIHNWVGGWMSEIPTSPRDPIFWVHHANVDRLWEVWLRLGDGRANPTDVDDWMNRQFIFYDENGRQVQMTGIQILDTVNQLDYRYDDQPVDDEGLAAATRGKTVAAVRQRQTTVVGSSDKGTVKLGAKTVDIGIDLPPDADTVGAGARTILTLERVRGTGVRGVSFEIYVARRKRQPNPRDPSFVGALGLFGLQPGDGHHAEHGGTQSFDITAALAASGKVSNKIEVTFVPRDLTDSGKLPGGTWATIDRLIISIETNSGSSGGTNHTKKRRNRKKRKQHKSSRTLPATSAKSGDAGSRVPGDKSSPIGPAPQSKTRRRASKKRPSASKRQRNRAATGPEDSTVHAHHE